MPRPRALADLGLFVHEGFLDAGDRRHILIAMAASSGEPAEVVTGEGALAHDEQARRAWDVALPGEIQDALIDRIDALRPAIQDAFGCDLQPCGGLAALRYPAGGFYGPHRDSTRTPDPLGLHLRRISVVVFVNGPDDPVEPFTGGELRLYDGEEGAEDPEAAVDMTPEAGTLVAFRSSTLHEVRPVGSGVRCTLVTWLGQAPRAPAM